LIAGTVRYRYHRTMKSTLELKHECEVDDRGLCATCEVRIRQEEELKSRKRKAWEIIEQSRVEMVAGLREVGEEDWMEMLRRLN